MQVRKPQFLQVIRGICIPTMASGHNSGLVSKVAIKFFLFCSAFYMLAVSSHCHLSEVSADIPGDGIFYHQ